MCISIRYFIHLIIDPFIDAFLHVCTFVDTSIYQYIHRFIPEERYISIDMKKKESLIK